MSASSVVHDASAQPTLARINVLRAALKASVLFLLFNAAYQLIQPVQHGLPTLYNSLVNGRERIHWSPQTNLPLLLNDHIIQRATADTWNVIMLGSSETYGDVAPYDTAISALNALGLQTADGRRVRFYNLAVPISDVWKDLMIAESVLQAGLPIDMVVLNTWAYAFENDYPHPFVTYNPEIAATVVGRYQIDTAFFAYVLSKGGQNLWSDRSILSAWFYDQSRALVWHLLQRDYPDRRAPIKPLITSLGINTDLKITRTEFLRAFRLMAEHYDVPLLVVNAPRAFDEDIFDTWIQMRSKMDHITLLDCAFTFAGQPGRFFDGIHLIPETFSLYGHILARHFSLSEMSAVSPQMPLRLPDDFAAPEEACVFLNGA